MLSHHTQAKTIFYRMKNTKELFTSFLVLTFLFLNAFLPMIHCIIRSDWIKIWPKHQTNVQWSGSESGSVAETGTWETKHHTRRVEELRFITPAGPEELTLQALGPKQRGYKVFIHRQAWLSRFVGLQGLGDCKEQDKGEWDNF